MYQGRRNYPGVVPWQHRAGINGTHWTLGNVARQALGLTSDVTGDESLTVSQSPPNTTLVTSIYYSSLFSKTVEIEPDCDEADFVNNPLPLLESLINHAKVGNLVRFCKSGRDLVNQNSKQDSCEDLVPAKSGLINENHHRKQSVFMHQLGY